MKRNKLILLILLLFSFQSSFAQEIQYNVTDSVKYFNENRRWYNEFTEHWFQFFDIPEEDIRQSIAQFEKISNDLKSSKNTWEGTYGNGGDTHGNYIHWSEDNGFLLLVVNKCNGGPTQIIKGRVVVTNSLVRLIPDKTLTSSFHHNHGGHGGISHSNKPINFVFVSWKGASYLIQSTQLREFADYAAGLHTEKSRNYDDWSYYSKVSPRETFSENNEKSEPEKSEKLSNDLPIFPEEYERYVKKPFKGEVVSVEKTFRRNKPVPSEEEGEYFLDIAKNYDDLVSEVKINLGKSSGIYPKIIMRFASDEENYDYDGIVITKVFDNYSIGEYVSDAPKRTCKKSDTENCTPAERKSLKKGIKLSTTGRW